MGARRTTTSAAKPPPSVEVMSRTERASIRLSPAKMTKRAKRKHVQLMKMQLPVQLVAPTCTHVMTCTRQLASICA